MVVPMEVVVADGMLAVWNYNTDMGREFVGEPGDGHRYGDGSDFG